MTFMMVIYYHLNEYFAWPKWSENISFFNFLWVINLAPFSFPQCNSLRLLISLLLLSLIWPKFALRLFGHFPSSNTSSPYRLIDKKVDKYEIKRKLPFLIYKMFFIQEKTFFSCRVNNAFWLSEMVGVRSAGSLQPRNGKCGYWLWPWPGVLLGPQPLFRLL